MMGRVAVLKAYGGDFELREYPVPDPEPGAILIRLTRAGVCGSARTPTRPTNRATLGTAEPRASGCAGPSICFSRTTASSPCGR